MIGYTPLPLLALEPGKHHVVVTPPDALDWLSQPWVGEVVLTSGDTTHIEVVFQRSYTIQSEPFGADVVVQQQPVGKTPVYVTLPETEWRTVTLSLPGYADTTFTIGLNEQELFRIVLKPAPDLAADVLKTQSLKKSGKTRKIIYTGVGLALLSGGLALYFRDKANDRFDRYKRTGNPAKFNKFYDDAKKFDRLAAVSFGVFQVSFVFSFTLFLKEANR